MKCPICETEEKKIFVHKILKKYDVNYYKCDRCGVINTEKPYWLDEAYSQPINSFDTGLMIRNEMIRKKIFNLICLCFDKNAKYRDFGGGHGILTRMMRDWGIDYYWSDKFGENIFAKGFEYAPSTRVELVSAIEVFEHMDSPMEDVADMLKSGDSIFFTTTPYTTVVDEDGIPNTDWWYYGFEHGQHIMLYSKKTLSYIAQYFHLQFYKIDGGTHMISARDWSSIYWNYVKANLRFDMGVAYRKKRYGKNFASSDNELLKRLDKENVNG